MSKSDAIAEIVKNLHKLSIEDSREVLELVKSKTNESNKSKPKQTILLRIHYYK